MPTSSPATCTSGTVPPGTTLATSKVQKEIKVIQATQGKTVHQVNQVNQVKTAHQDSLAPTDAP